MSDVLVPYTPIIKRYHDTIGQNEEARLAGAQELAADPSPLAREFADSVTELGARYHNEAPFYPKPRFPREPREPGINNGTDLAWQLHRQCRLPVLDDPTLDVDWVEYEVGILSTRGRAVFDTPARRPAGGPLTLNLLLVNDERLPALGEVKVRRDKEPFSALVQLLVYAAHLATPSQYRRLRTHFAEAGFPDVDVPRFDGYLLLFHFGDSNATYLDAFDRVAKETSAGLMQEPAITRHLRRLACLDLDLEAVEPEESLVSSPPYQELRATTHWVHAG